MSNPSEIVRKLAAIVFTDIVDFTHLSSIDEIKALDLIDKQRELLKPIVKSHEGEWLKEIGDGLLFSFKSSIEAVDCAIEIQSITKEYEDLDLRIGIHQGDILIRNQDIFGDDVNIASRIESCAAPLGIAISHKINGDISSNPKYQTKFLLSPKFKGVKQHIDVFAIINDNLPEPNINELKMKLEPTQNYKYHILFSTIFSIITISLIANFFLLSNDTDVKTASIYSTTSNQFSSSTNHSEDIKVTMRKIHNYLDQTTIESNFEALVLSQELMAFDSTQGDFIALLGLSYAQRSLLNQHNNKLMEEALHYLKRSKDEPSINKEQLIGTYIYLSKIYIAKNNITNAKIFVDKAQNIDRNYKDVRNLRKKITRLMLTESDNV